MEKESVEEILEKKLREIWDDDDYVLGIKIISGSENWQKIIDFLAIAKEQGDDVTSEDISRLALIFKKERLNKR